MNHILLSFVYVLHPLQSFSTILLLKSLSNCLSDWIFHPLLHVGNVTLPIANLPISVTGLSNLGSLSHCISGLLFSLLPFILPSKMTFPNPSLLFQYNRRNILGFVSLQSLPSLTLRS